MTPAPTTVGIGRKKVSSSLMNEASIKNMAHNSATQSHEKIKEKLIYSILSAAHNIKKTQLTKYISYVIDNYLLFISIYMKSIPSLARNIAALLPTKASHDSHHNPRNQSRHEYLSHIRS